MRFLVRGKPWERRRVKGVTLHQTVFCLELYAASPGEAEDHGKLPLDTQAFTVLLFVAKAEENPRLLEASDSRFSLY